MTKTDPDQCIICLEPLGGVLLPSPVTTTTIAAPRLEAGLVVAPPATTIDKDLEVEAARSDPLNRIAALDGCDHILHDACIRLWAEKTNTCPICRETFHNVRIFDGVDGTAITSFRVEDKKQVADFDPQQWLDENPEADDEESVPCPVCNSAEREDVLLLCDGCDAAYHTYCIGLNHVPSGNWYCLECADVFQPADEDVELQEDDAGEEQPHHPPQRRPARRRFPRTRERMRRARRDARSLAWAGPWGEITGRVYDAYQFDLDNPEGDESLEDYRRSQRQRQREHLEYQRWQQRVNIASRLGAREIFTNSLPRAARQQLQQRPEPVPESRDEVRAWGAFERAREVEKSSPSSRKRRLPSATASPGEPSQEPERRLKRPRTKRVPAQGEASSSRTSTLPSGRVEAGPSSRSPPHEAPTFLSSLLREVEMSTPSDDENVKNYFGQRQAVDASSPGGSPPPSSQNSPRALSITPPPLTNGRPSSPTLSLSSYVEPRFPPANYSPARSSRDNSDTESRPVRNGGSAPEIRQPRPRRPQPSPPARTEESPVRPQLSPEAKASINGIVRSALKPHWHAQELTTEQYSTINRDVSRKLYEEIRDPSSLDEEAITAWKKIASKEVARAVAESKA